MAACLVESLPLSDIVCRSCPMTGVTSLANQATQVTQVTQVTQCTIISIPTHYTQHDHTKLTTLMQYQRAFRGAAVEG